MNDILHLCHTAMLSKTHASVVHTYQLISQRRNGTSGLITTKDVPWPCSNAARQCPYHHRPLQHHFTLTTDNQRATTFQVIIGKHLLDTHHVSQQHLYTNLICPACPGWISARGDRLPMWQLPGVEQEAVMCTETHDTLHCHMHKDQKNLRTPCNQQYTSHRHRTRHASAAPNCMRHAFVACNALHFPLPLPFQDA